MRSMRLWRTNPAPSPAGGEGRATGENSPRTAGGETVHRNAETKKIATIWGVALIAIGVLVLLVSLLGGPMLADAGMSLSAGLMVAGFVLALEPRLVRDIGEAAGAAAASTATKIADERTAGLRERVEHLENLRELQSNIAADRQTAASRLIEKMREDPDFESTAELLEKAHDQHLFRDIRLRSGSDRETLMSLTWTPGYRPSPLELIDPDWSTLELQEFHLDNIELSAISATGEDSAVSHWSPGESVREAWNNFLDACERDGLVPTKFDPATMFDALATSYGAMIEARRSPADDPRRLHGRLRMLINDEWAITDEGLESRISSYSYQSHPGGDEQCPVGHDEKLWQDATYYSRVLLDP